jgi:hypothetical protein
MSDNNPDEYQTGIDEESLWQWYGKEGYWMMNGRQDALQNAAAYNLQPPDDVYQESYDNGYRDGLYWKQYLKTDTM